MLVLLLIKRISVTDTFLEKNMFIHIFLVFGVKGLLIAENANIHLPSKR